MVLQKVWRIPVLFQRSSPAERDALLLFAAGIVLERTWLQLRALVILAVAPAAIWQFTAPLQYKSTYSRKLSFRG